MINISALTLKLIALIFMIIDHIGYFFADITPIYLRILGRIAAPIFIFLFVESYYKTSAKNKYIKRLLLYSLLMTTSNLFILMLYNFCNIPCTTINILKPNIFLTFSIGFAILNTLNGIKTTKRITKLSNSLFLLLTLITLIAFVEYHIYALFLIILFYYSKDNKTVRNVLFISGSLILSILDNNIIQSAMVLSLIFIQEYDGKLLPNKSSLNRLFNKMFFYNFYIFHILILSLVVLFLKLINLY